MWISSRCLILFIATGLCRNALCRSTFPYTKDYLLGSVLTPRVARQCHRHHAAIAGLTLLTAAQISPYLKSGAVSVVSYARALMRRVNQRNDVVKAWRHIGVLSFRRENMSIL